ncbi:hypothetical protein SAMN04488104_10112 [Algoriphagus faecimaris]|uniref:Uncharacterized protein n=1 Tax=Algoriphagus faecimaris TaxID=686796 RepID=A0A1G6QYX5_9BACT|nr:DUF5715 family protein [Algoriphagus faecimaris]SDC97589.1 hypothetical protein SAMN04488104_10112 [Algoriphagus faecimaris]
MKKTTLFFVFLFFTLFSLGTLAMVTYQPALKKRLSETYAILIGDPAPNIVDQPLELPELMPKPEDIFIVPDLSTFKGRLRKDSYSNHLSAAEETSNSPILDEEQLFQLVKDGALVEVNSGKGYEVEKLTHSHPYLTSESKKVLEQIGQTFQALVGDEGFFTVTSGTRTIDQQKKLGRRNRNATKGISTHSYGRSFDISYIRFNGVKSWDYKKQKQLEKVLSHFQKENKIFVIKERKQNCFHITVR